MDNRFLLLRPMLYCTDLPGTMEYYKSVLGFQCLSYDESHGWAEIQKDKVTFMLSLPNDHLAFEKCYFTGSFYINVANVDQLWHEIHDKVEVVYPIQTFEYGMKEFAIFDFNGYLLQFGSPIIEQI